MSQEYVDRMNQTLYGNTAQSVGYPMPGANHSNAASQQAPEAELSSRLTEAHISISSIAGRLEQLADRIAPEPRDLADCANLAGTPRSSLTDKVANIHRTLARAESALKRIEGQI